MLGNGLMMGLSPNEVRQLTLSEFEAIQRAWIDAHRTPGDGRKMDQETEARLTRRMLARKAARGRR